MARTYCLSLEELDSLEQNSDRAKRRKAQASTNVTPRFFHPEDEQFQQVSRLSRLGDLSFKIRGQASMYSVHYPFTNAQPRDPDAFGLDTRGCLMLVPADGFLHLISDMQDRYHPS